MTNINERMRILADELNKASALYYTSGDSPMSDAQWDQKYNELLALEKESGIVLPDSPSVRVGAEPLSSFEPHRHISRAFSGSRSSRRRLSAASQRSHRASCSGGTVFTSRNRTSMA